MRSGSVAVLMALAVCVIASSSCVGVRADGADWVTVASTAADAAVAAVDANAAAAAAADADADAAAELAPVVAMEVSAAAAIPAPFTADEQTVDAGAAESASESEATDLSSLSMVEVGANADSLDFASLGEAGTFRLSEESQEEIITDALEQLEVEFIRSYGTDSDRDQLDAILAEDQAADQALEAGDAMRFAHTEAGAEAERRRRRKKRGGGGGAANIAAQCARLGFTSGNTSPQGLAQQAGPKNARKMGGGFFKRLGRGLKKFARKAGNWLKDRFGGNRKNKNAPQPQPQPQPQAQQPGQPQPPAPAAGAKKGGWFGRMFNKVKAVGQKVGGFMNKWGNKAAGWGKGLAQFGAKAFGGSKLGQFLGQVGGGMQKWGSKIGQLGGKIQAFLNGKPVPVGTKGAVVLPQGVPPPPPGMPGGLGGPKIVPGMPGTYKDAKGKWRGPGGRRVYTAKQQARRALRKAERKAAREARRAARERRRAEKQAKSDRRDQRDLQKHLEWRQRKLEQKARRDAKKRVRRDYSGIDPDFPGAGWRQHTAEEIEDCVTCRYVWLQVEQDIGNTQMEDNVYDAFNQNALEAMKQPIFYPAVQIMYDAVDDMIGDYMDGLTVNQICENSLLCRMPEN